MNRKYFAAGMALALSLVWQGPTARADDSKGTLDRIASSGVFVIGYRTDASPLSYENADGKPSGYSVDICRRIATAIKAHLGLDSLETKFVAVESKDRISAVANRDIDIECGSTTITMTRQEEVDFTLPTFVTGGSVLSISESGIQRLSDLSGKKVGIVKDTTTVEQLRSYLTQNLIDAEVVVLKNRDTAMIQLNKGDIDAFASDQIVLIGQIIEALYPNKYSLMNETFSYEPYGLVVRRDDADFRLVANRALAQLYRSGQHIEMYNKWIGRIGIRPSPILAAMYQLNTIPE